MSLNKFLIAAAVSIFAANAADGQRTMQMQIPVPPPNAQIFVFEGGSYLGVQAQEITKENYAKHGLGEVRGVVIERITENSPAAQAGLQKGDIIVKLNGEEISGTRKLTRLISEIAPDHQVTLTIIRSGAEQEIKATVAQRPMPENIEGGIFRRGAVPILMPNLPPSGEMQTMPFPGSVQPPNVFVYRSNSRQIGISTAPLNKQLAEYFGAGDGGILISSVRENGAAAKAGIKAGDVIVEINGKKAAGASDLLEALSDPNGGDLNLIVIRDKNRQSVRVTPENSGENKMKIQRMIQSDAPPSK